MASLVLEPAVSPPSAHVVGNAFVNQYYHILRHSPELVHRFYQEESNLGRPEPLGAMNSVTTMQAINEKILSMEYEEQRAEIKTVDSQESLNGGVIVLVTGYLTGKDKVKRDFAQSFFLATQEKGYFVLNDIFRYVDGTNNLQEIPTVAESLMPQEQGNNKDAEIAPGEEKAYNGMEVCNPSENEEVAEIEEEAPCDEVANEAPISPQTAVTDSGSVSVPNEAPKKSYASIVKFPASLSAPLSVPRPSPPSTDRQAIPAPVTAPPPEIPSASSNTTENNSTQDTEDGHSIYIKALPMNATAAQLEAEFKKFGPIKANGIQVRSHKQQGYCFGFVEFEAPSAVQSAIEASPIMIGGRPVYVEEKRPTGSRAGSWGWFPAVRGGGFRSDGLRGRGGYGRGYGRGDYSNQTNYGGWGGSRGGYSGRRGEVSYQRVDHSSAGRGGEFSYQRVNHSSGRGNRSGSLPAPRTYVPRVISPT